MDTKFGVDTLKTFATALGQVVALAYGFLVEKSGIWAILWGIQAPAAILQGFFTSVKLAAAKKEVLDLSKEEYVSVVDALLMPLQPSLKAKLMQVEDLVEKIIDLMEQVIAVGHSTYAQAQVIIKETKVLIGA